MELTFFGLTPDYRLNLFNQIHDIVFNSNGGYDWNTIYNMPIWLRNFIHNKIYEYYEKKNNINQENTVEQSIKNMKAAGAVNNTKVQVPTYVTKASKK